ncbi:hypothetical protein M8494_31950 [Serratia ureilytica]
MFSVGMGTILWMHHFKQPGEYINIYRSYMSTGKLQLATAFILLIALNERLCVQHLPGRCSSRHRSGDQRWLFPHQGLRLLISRVGSTSIAPRSPPPSDDRYRSGHDAAILMLRTRYRLVLYICGIPAVPSLRWCSPARCGHVGHPVACLSLLATKQLVSENTSLRWWPRYRCS